MFIMDCSAHRVVVATGYGMDNWVSIPDRGQEIFSFLQRPHRNLGPHALLSNGYRGIFAGGKAARS
jgi:hypothetical protein